MSKDIQHRKQVGLAVAAAFAVATLFVPQVASAQLINPLDTIKLTDGPGNGPGGQFTATIFTGVSASESFQTFCLEHSETFSYGQELQVKTITNGARTGGPGAVDIGGGVFSDPISDQTAWLYTQFRSAGYGALTGYGGANQANDADALQNVFWYLENEITSLTSGLSAGEATSANTWLAAANTAVGGGWTNAGNGNRVQVLNLYKGAGYTLNSQDQLYFAPPEIIVHTIPEPETYAMLLAGLGLMGFVARRRKLKAMSI